MTQLKLRVKLKATFSRFGVFSFPVCFKAIKILQTFGLFFQKDGKMKKCNKKKTKLVKAVVVVGKKSQRA
jgi:hypothetical protein